MNSGTTERTRLPYIGPGKIIPTIPTELHIQFPEETISTTSERSWLNWLGESLVPVAHGRVPWVVPRIFRTFHQAMDPQVEVCSV